MSDRKKAFWFIALLSVLVVVPFLGETIFYSKGEPREAIVALSMLESGNWILPVNYGTDIAYKPPFFYWSIAAVSSLFGEVTEFSARFPSALAFLAMQLMFFAFVAKRKNVQTAFLASILLLSSFEVHRAAVACRVDMVQVAFIVISLCLLFRWDEKGCRVCSKNSRDSTTPRPSIVTGGLPFDLGFYHYTLPRTFYRFYHAVEQQNGKFLCFTVSCNKSALGFRLRRTSPRRSSLCASHFIESVGNECKRGTSGIQPSHTLWSEKNELSQPMGLTSFFFCLDHTTIHLFCQVFLFELPQFFASRTVRGSAAWAALPLPTLYPRKKSWRITP